MTVSETRVPAHRLEAHSGVLVDPGWLAGHLGDPGLRVVEVDVSPAAYHDWHIDGAVLWNVYQDLKDADYRLAGTTALDRLVARSGIGPDSTVVFYGYAPAMGLWLMELYGHRDARILDCSRDGAGSGPVRGPQPRGVHGPDVHRRASNAAVKQASRSCRTNFTLIPASSRSIRRFLACCTTQDWTGFSVAPRTRIRRVSCSITART